MHLKVAKWIMRAIVVLVVGVMLTAVIISAGLGRQARMTMKEEKKAKAKNSYTEKEMTITEKFRDINIQVADDMDVKLVESDDDKCHVTYFDSPDVIHSLPQCQVMNQKKLSKKSFFDSSVFNIYSHFLPCVLRADEI